MATYRSGLNRLTLDELRRLATTDAQDPRLVAVGLSPFDRYRLALLRLTYRTHGLPLADRPSINRR
jgi:hypothetical protein